MENEGKSMARIFLDTENSEDEEVSEENARIWDVLCMMWQDEKGHLPRCNDITDDERKSIEARLKQWWAEEREEQLKELKEALQALRDPETPESKECVLEHLYLCFYLTYWSGREDELLPQIKALDLTAEEHKLIEDYFARRELEEDEASNKRVSEELMRNRS